MELSQICWRRSWYQSGPLNVGYTGLKMAIFGSVRVGENFIKIFCNRDEKIDNMAGRSGIGVLVTGFSRVGALKKHARSSLVGMRKRKDNPKRVPT